MRSKLRENVEGVRRQKRRQTSWMQHRRNVDVLMYWYILITHVLSTLVKDTLLVLAR